MYLDNQAKLTEVYFVRVCGQVMRIYLTQVSLRSLYFDIHINEAGVRYSVYHYKPASADVIGDLEVKLTPLFEKLTNLILQYLPPARCSQKIEILYDQGKTSRFRFIERENTHRVLRVYRSTTHRSCD